MTYTAIPYEISCKEEQLRLFTFHFWLIGNILEIISFEVLSYFRGSNCSSYTEPEVVHDSLELEIESDGHVGVHSTSTCTYVHLSNLLSVPSLILFFPHLDTSSSSNAMTLSIDSQRT